MDILLEKYKTLLNYCLHRPTVVHTSPAGVYHHFINTYVFLYDKLSCPLAVSRAQDEWRASISATGHSSSSKCWNALYDIKYYRLHVTVYICGDL